MKYLEVFGNIIWIEPEEYLGLCQKTAQEISC